MKKIVMFLSLLLISSNIFSQAYSTDYFIKNWTPKDSNTTANPITLSYVQNNYLKLSGGTLTGLFTSVNAIFNPSTEIRINSPAGNVIPFAVYSSDGQYLLTLEQVVDDGAGRFDVYGANGISIFNVHGGLKILTLDGAINLGKSGGTTGSMTFIASDNDQATININTSDQLSFSGGSGGYNFADEYIEQIGVVGTTTNDNAAAGNIGEYLASNVVSGSAVSLTSTETKNIDSLSLTAGDWDITGLVKFSMSGATATDFKSGFSTTSATLADDTTYIQKPFSFSGLSSTYGESLPIVRISISGTTKIYFIAQSTFSLGTVSAFGTIRARRVR